MLECMLGAGGRVAASSAIFLHPPGPLRRADLGPRCRAGGAQRVGDRRRQCRHQDGQNGHPAGETTGEAAVWHDATILSVGRTRGLAATMPWTVQQAMFARLSAAPRKRLCVIGGATHLMLLEEQRGQLYEVVEAFLGAP